MEADDVFMFLLLFAAALGAGGLVAVELALRPAMLAMPDRESVRLHQVFDRFIHRYMPVTTIASEICTIVLLIIGDLDDLETVLLIVAGVCMANTIIVSQFFNVPINRIVLSWSLDAIPDEYPQLLARWGRFNIARTFTAVVAFLCFAAAVISA
jgi:uncharacterized membrane protein